MQLFSRIVIMLSLRGRMTFHTARTAFQMTNESTQAVMATPNAQPSLTVV
jgi:hypothetical protein